MSASVDYWEDQEVVTIETPENLELRLPLAGIGPRFLALFLDMLLQGVISTVLVSSFVLIGMFWLGNDPSDSMFSGFVIILILALMLVYFGYPLIFEWIWNGQTPGKRWAGIRVVSQDGLPLGIKEVVLRNILRMVDYLPSYGFVGLLAFMTTKNQQRIGDVVAGTVVVREFTSKVPLHWPSGTGTATYPTSGEGTISPKLAYAMGSYLSRCNKLPDDVRLELTGEIIRQLGYDPSQMLLRDREGYLSSLLASRAGAY